MGTTEDSIYGGLQIQPSNARPASVSSANAFDLGAKAVDRDVFARERERFRREIGKNRTRRLAAVGELGDRGDAEATSSRAEIEDRKRFAAVGKQLQKQFQHGHTVVARDQGTAIG